jgi:glycosyltransferase involved in cell wall biosynthesis
MNNFDWITYINNYEDLQKTGINTKEKALIHWNKFGIYEKRTCDDLKSTKTQNILHITHNLGGGTETYVNNMCSILNNNYNHYVIKILSEDYYLINNIICDYYDINNFIQNKNFYLIIVQHLLYIKNNIFSINLKILEFLLTQKSKMIFIIHDYFLFNETNPNPTKIMFEQSITQQNIFFVENLLQKFDLVLFNSQDTFNNYNKFIKINNYRILNCVPDIDIYHKRIYPTNKKVIVIGLIGTLNALHKGCNLASLIFKLFANDTNYKFVIIGTYDNKNRYKNVLVHGKYVDKDIFNLIKMYNIDCFLFVSIVIETYSFALSLALNTGLPIIYNNIGAYVSRLSNYENCYSYEENNIENIKNILEIIRNKSKIETENNEIIKYELYKNLPDLSDYVMTDDQLNFDLSNIKSNINNKNVFFIHYFDEKENTKIFIEFFDFIKKSELYDKLDYIFITILGKHIYLPQDYKIKIIHYSNIYNNYCTLERIKYFSNNITDDIKIMYLEFVNYTENNMLINYMKEYVIKDYEYNKSMVEKMKFLTIRKNFWYSTSEYLKEIFTNYF